MATPEAPLPPPTEEAVPLPPPQGKGPVSAEGNAELEIDNDTPYELALEFEGLTSHIAGTWELAGDRKYGHCFFIVTQFQQRARCVVHSNECPGKSSKGVAV